MRTNLKVPYEEKDDAKKLGARWDAARKTWYVENIAKFMRWAPCDACLDKVAEAGWGLPA